jgi:hypothetical protein
MSCFQSSPSPPSLRQAASTASPRSWFRFYFLIRCVVLLRPSAQAAWSQPRSGLGACLGPDPTQEHHTSPAWPSCTPGHPSSPRSTAPGRPSSSWKPLRSSTPTPSPSLRPPSASIRSTWLRPSPPFRLLPPPPPVSASWVLVPPQASPRAPPPPRAPTLRLATTAIVRISTWRACAAAAVGISTWRADAATLFSVEDNTASTYDFHATHGKTNVIM